MIFKPEGFRQLEGNAVPLIRPSTRMTLILVAADGFATYAIAVSDKDALLARRKQGDLLLLAWMGEWRTDVFLLSDSDLEKYYRKPK
jgi:hypothetical protein